MRPNSPSACFHGLLCAALTAIFVGSAAIGISTTNAEAAGRNCQINIGTKEKPKYVYDFSCKKGGR